jgi:hypothetical protein
MRSDIPRVYCLRRFWHHHIYSWQQVPYDVRGGRAKVDLLQHWWVLRITQKKKPVPHIKKLSRLLLPPMVIWINGN